MSMRNVGAGAAWMLVGTLAACAGVSTESKSGTGTVPEAKAEAEGLEDSVATEAKAHPKAGAAVDVAPEDSSLPAAPVSGWADAPVLNGAPRPRTVDLGGVGKSVSDSAARKDPIRQWSRSPALRPDSKSGKPGRIARSSQALRRGASGADAAGPMRDSSRDADRLRLARALAQGEELWVIARHKPVGAPSAEAAPGTGALLATVEGKERPMPLKHTAVSARIDGHIATVQLKQAYHNPFASKVEAVYVFPLPDDAAVSEFVMVIGDRRIRGIIRDRAEAETIYRAARRQGYVASLLTQERPNIFTQKVANIEPGRAIDIELTYYNALPYRDGAYEFSFPMVVGPRFNPPGHSAGVGAVARGQEGRSGQTTEVSYLPPTERSGHDVSMAVDLDAGVEILGLDSLHHAIEVDAPAKAARRVRLAKKRVIPNRDFILRYRVAGEGVKSGWVRHEDERGGFFNLLLTPPAELKGLPRTPREMIFVLDCSGSMRGVPLQKAKRAVRRVLKLMDADDTFQIIRFSNRASKMGPSPVPATRANIEKGLRYLEGLEGTGGTMMIEGIKAALDFPHRPGSLRLVSFMTDGYIGNEIDILSAINEKLGASRIFSFGVGSSVNRFLLERMAQVGRGAVAYIPLNDNAADDAVDAFYERIAYPALSDVKIRFDGVEAYDVYPRRIPDLHVGRPVAIAGRYRNLRGARAVITGRVGGKVVRYRVALDPAEGRSNPAIAQIWARSRVADLMNQAYVARDVDQVAEDIKSTALSYSLMSQFTAFVAVDSSRRTAGDHGTTVKVPVPVPDGVRYDTTVEDRGG